MSDKKITFETIAQVRKTAADVTIYKNGMARFGKAAIEKYDLREAQLVWGESEDKTVLALGKERGGRVLRGEHKDTTSCPLRIAVRHVGRYAIACEDGVLLLRPMT